MQDTLCPRSALSERPTKRMRALLVTAAGLGLILAGCGGASSASPKNTASVGGTSNGSGAGAGTGSGTGSGAGTGTGTGSGSGTGGGANPPSSTPAKSSKRGIAYDLADPADLSVLSPATSWWYNWSASPNSHVPANYASAYGMEFDPMLWDGNFNDAAVTAWLKINPAVHYVLVLNEPNLTSQANLTPQQAATLWPRYEAIAAQTGVKIVGPAITWGTMPGYQDPVVWMDAFYSAYEAANGGRKPQIDYLAFHWYDYGLSGQLDRLTKYGKPFWVTEFANWHSQNDGAQIDTAAKQQMQMTSMVATCESRTDVFRYAWFTGRVGPDPHFDSLLAGSGTLTDLGGLYLSLPW